MGDDLDTPTVYECNRGGGFVIPWLFTRPISFTLRVIENPFKRVRIWLWREMRFQWSMFRR